MIVPSSGVEILDNAVHLLAKDAQQDSYRTNPQGWAEDVLGLHMWSKQVQVCESVRDHKRTTVAAAHSVGKSAIASVLACWWIAVHPPGEAIVITTAPTYRQVNAILWEEMRKHHRVAEERGFPLPGKITGADVWKLDNGQIVGFGRKPKDGDSHAFQGIHRRYVLVIIDEACGVMEELWTGVEAITTTANSRILAIGNPDDRETTFGDTFCDVRYEKLWNRISIPAHDSPNFTGEQVPDPLPDVLVQRSWVQDRLQAWGEEDPRYKSKVLAEFSEDGEMGLFNSPLLAQAFIDDDEKVAAQGDLVIGMDVARFGDDANTVAARRGRLCWIEDTWRGMDTVSSAQKLHDLAWAMARKYEEGPLKGTPSEVVDIRIDSVGVGAGVVDSLAAMRAKYEATYPDRVCWFTVREMNGAARPPQDLGGSIKGYGNARAYWHDQLKHQMRNGSVKMMQHEKLHDELRMVRIRYSMGRMYIESKEEIRRRGGKSPDFADAMIYACAPVYSGPQAGDMVTASAHDVAARAHEELIQSVAAQMSRVISPF